MGGSINDNRGEITSLFRGYIGHGNNNLVELETLIHSLLIARHKGLHPFIDEGNSYVII